MLAVYATVRLICGGSDDSDGSDVQNASLLFGGHEAVRPRHFESEQPAIVREAESAALIVISSQASSEHTRKHCDERGQFIVAARQAFVDEQ